MISLKNLPERPPNFARPGAPDPIGAMINTIEATADAAIRDRFDTGAGNSAGGPAMTDQALTSDQAQARRAVAAAADPQPALRAQCRSRRESARPRRICDPGVRLRLCHPRRTAGDVRGRRRQPRRAPHRVAGRDRDRAARYRRPQRRGAGHRRQGAEPVRRAAPHHRQGRGDRTSDRDACPTSTPAKCATACRRARASSG